MRNTFLFLLILCALTLSLTVILITSETVTSAKLTSPQPTASPKTNPYPIYGHVIRHGSGLNKEVALTFDADMTPFMLKQLNEGKVASYYNDKVIDILKKNNVPATLFIAGLWAETYPEITRDLAQNPLFEIGNHSYSHPAFARPCFNLSPINENEKELELKLSQETLKKITGQTPKLFRFPGGCYLIKDLELTKNYGLTVVHWDVDGRDAFSSSQEKIFQAVKRETKSGSILIFHLNGPPNAPETDKALPEVIDWLRNEGYKMVKVSELLLDYRLPDDLEK